jgi:hypothetical protein
MALPVVSALVRRSAAWMAAVFAVVLSGGSLQARPDALRRSGDESWSTSLLFDYDTSRFRTSAWHLGTEIEYGSWEQWAQLELDTYSSFNAPWDLRSDSYATLQFGRALHRDKERRLFINATLSVDVRSRLSSYGGDVTPQAEVVWGISEDWWVGGNIGGVLATAPEEDVKRGYLSGNVWVSWQAGWLSDDALSLNIWAAGNEIPQDDKVLFVELEYTFSVSDSLDITVGCGTDPISPWDHLGFFGTAGLRWTF